ncbi:MULTISPECIES: hypothetical protein [Agrobacterium]|jgi:hypothetical protein|uniref:DUF3240 domain-containing protein n=2 Tax=Agrobacterium tumefaciens complex TaxID=1183400 RepID=A0AAW8M070_AGRTU|nr:MULTISPECIES: hypothetical protein [Agrobacterium]MCP2137977.1 hypothetical protein [Rhizobium sp. SLBN-94]EPR23408.1 hypothetical protein L902_00270 [Agrobacterium radiobacter DSM 30147]KAB0459155.1 hypothetical protein F7R04_15225 [Agrobacterium tumefaciens]KWT75356.1 hypothetical protein ASH09_18670 [Agrobacterium radiobacter]MBB4320668.1 hypothetical protein [Agrobacterium radiobacter]
MSYLVEILLPVTANMVSQVLDTICYDLTEQFGGVTIHEKAPAEGFWKDGRKVEHDHIFLVEVMTDEINRSWWAQYRERLALMLSQEEIVVRAIPFERL